MEKLIFLLQKPEIIKLFSGNLAAFQNEIQKNFKNTKTSSIPQFKIYTLDLTKYYLTCK